MSTHSTLPVSLIAVASLLFSACVSDSRALSAATPAQGMMLQPAAELEAIMQRTEEGMLAIAPCDSADYYFTEAIVPHRKGAVELCEWMFEHGTNPQLQNISSAVYDSPTEDQIYQTQQYVPACSSAPSAALVYPQSGSSAGKINGNPAVAIRSSMSMNLSAPLNGNPDHDFAVEMFGHHWASINMARVQLLRGSYGALKALATELIVTQTRQCEQFRHILQSQYATII